MKIWDGVERRKYMRDLSKMSEREILIVAVNDVGHIKENQEGIKKDLADHALEDNRKFDKVFAAIYVGTGVLLAAEVFLKR